MIIVSVQVQYLWKLLTAKQIFLIKKNLSSPLACTLHPLDFFNKTDRKKLELLEFENSCNSNWGPLRIRIKFESNCLRFATIFFPFLSLWQFVYFLKVFCFMMLIFNRNIYFFGNTKPYIHLHPPPLTFHSPSPTSIHLPLTSTYLPPTST